MLKMFKQHWCKHPPRRLFLRGRFLPGRSSNKVLLRMNLKTLAPKSQRRSHPPLQNWRNFFRECGTGQNCEGDILSGTGSGGVSGQTQGPGMAGTVCKHPTGCSVPDLVKFYANCNITNAVVTCELNERKKKKLKFMPKI